MKTVSTICVYHGTQIYNLTVNYKGELTQLKWNGLGDSNVKEYDSFRELYKAILTALKANGFKVRYINAFNTNWYDIQFIDAMNPTHIETLSFKE